ncbi:MAG TPA: flagellar biosynthesis protein FlhA [Candidatus Eremiobacteraeota bacterium]|nr:MAG: Flagellar biosynthesis protein FlhA [bacterium ADurb.Bin363]HPZ07022.1 flagellar biosynthesis protein FlhA [Candidatus Eremiobacteraeota bacterium]
MQGALGLIQKVGRSSDLVTAVLLVMIIGLIIIKIPPFFLDILLVINISMSIITLMISIFIQEPLQFAVFPTLLLVATLFRVALDISTLRLILLDGHKGAGGVGHVVVAFGEVAMGGDLIVGLIIFIVIIVVNFMVITSGAERIAQVGARFTLDAMPGKQMAIDADLNAGLIDPETAKARRSSVERESDFYGAMDGAGKFVKGDAIASVIIIVIAIIGGILMGVLRQGMTAGEALVQYATLSVGNGLITTLPAFLMSTAMGMVVSRAASDANLGADVFKQVTAQPKALLVAGVFMMVFFVLGITNILPLPPVPFLILGIAACVVGWILQRHHGEIDISNPKHEAPATAEQAAEQQIAETKAEDEEVKKKPENVVQLMAVDPISLEVGRGLLALVDPNQGAKLLDRVTSIRRHIALEMGIVVPGVRFRDNLQLKPNGYIIKIKDIEVAAGEVIINKFLAIGPENHLKSLKGPRCFDPTYGMPAVWITADQRGEAERVGCMIFDPVSVMATQITEIIRTHASELLGRQEVAALLETVKKSHPAVVKEIYPDLFTLGEIQKVLQNLVKEKLSIRDLVTILETLGDYAHITKDTDMLTEYVRQAMCRVICREYQNNEGTITVITLDPELENIIAGAVQRTEYGSFLTLDPNTGQMILTAMGEQIQALMDKGMQPIVLCSPQVRLYLRRLTERPFPNLVVLSYNEIAPKVNVNSVGLVTLPMG